MHIIYIYVYKSFSSNLKKAWEKTTKKEERGKLENII